MNDDIKAAAERVSILVVIVIQGCIRIDGLHQTEGEKFVNYWRWHLVSILFVIPAGLLLLRGKC